MLEEGSLIKIVKSDELESMALSDFVGLEGAIVTDLTGSDRKMRGYIVHIPQGVPLHAADEYDTWFIPLGAVKSLEP